MADDRTIDEIDRSILDILQMNARQTQAEISRVVGLAPSAVLERMRKLEARQVIRGYTAQVDPAVADQAMLSFVAVRSIEGAAEENVARDLAQLPQVLEVHHVAGEDCYLLKVRTKNAEALGQLLRTTISRIPGVRSTRTTIVLETMKETSRLLIARKPEEA